MNIYEIRWRHLDKQHDNNKNTGSVGSINKICYIKKAIKKANNSLFIFKCLRKKSLRVEGAKPVKSSLTFWFTAWISQALLPAAMWAIKMVFKTEVHCAGSKESWRVGQKSGRSHWAWPDAGVTERERQKEQGRERERGGGLSLVNDQSHGNMNNYSVILKAEPGFHFGTSLLIERNALWAPPPPSSPAGQRTGARFL